MGLCSPALGKRLALRLGRWRQQSDVLHLASKPASPSGTRETAEKHGCTEGHGERSLRTEHVTGVGHCFLESHRDADHTCHDRRVP